MGLLEANEVSDLYRMPDPEYTPGGVAAKPKPLCCYGKDFTEKFFGLLTATAPRLFRLSEVIFTQLDQPTDCCCSAANMCGYVD